MAKTRYKIIVIMLVFSYQCSPVFSKERVQNLSLWLINMATTNTLNEGMIQLDVVSRYTNYRAPDVRGEVADFQLLAGYGFANNLSATVVVPYSWVDATPHRAGISDLTFSLRYGVRNGMGPNVALSSEISFPSGSKDALRGAGRISYRLVLHLGIYNGRYKLLGNIGFGRSGYIASRIAHNPSGSLRHESEVLHQQNFTLSGGGVFDLAPILSISIEGFAQVVPEFSDQDFHGQIGGILRPTKSLHLKASAGVGVPREEGTLINSRATLRLSYFID